MELENLFLNKIEPVGWVSCYCGFIRIKRKYCQSCLQKLKFVHFLYETAHKIQSLFTNYSIIIINDKLTICN